MKKLFMLFSLLLFGINSNTLTSNTNSILSNSNEKYLYEFQINRYFNVIVDEAFNVYNITDCDITDIPLGFPIENNNIKRISSFYGKRQIHPILKTRTYHNGIDLVADNGTEVFATANGTVKRIGYQFGFGNFIEISHIEEISTIYAHLNKTNVKIGEKVEIDQLIGTVGSTGLSTGPHLHYEIRKNFNPIDPLTIYRNSEVYLQNTLTIAEITKKVQMKNKTVTKSFSLEELKALKDEYVSKINIRLYNIKSGKVKKLETLTRSLIKIEMDQKNLIIIKDILARANSIEYSSKNNGYEELCNNRNIYELSLLRDLKTALKSVESNKDFSEEINSSLLDLNARIKEIEKQIKDFNSEARTELSLLTED